MYFTSLIENFWCFGCFNALQERSKDYSRPVLYDLVATSHMWLLSTDRCQSQLRCAISVKYTLNFADLAGKKEHKLFQQ